MTAAHIKRHIACLSDDKPFSTREFLAYGSRAAVDQTLWRLVQRGEIIRVARGLFIKKDSDMPSVTEVAKAKAAAFGRTIAEHGISCARALGLITEKPDSKEALYACNGRTSSFRFGDIVIKLIGTSPRKLSLGDDRVGLVLRALWNYGKAACNMEIASHAASSLNRTERQVLRQSICFMPYWMPQCFRSFKRDKPKKKVKASANRHEPGIHPPLFFSEWDLRWLNEQAQQANP